VQLGGWVYRTYTPLSWNSIAGSTELLLYLHGEGPGATWTRSIAVGDTCALLGPRTSLDLTALARPALVFGDETSLGLVHALRFTPRKLDDVVVVLEVESRAASEEVLENIGVRNVELVERRPNDSHLGEVEQVVVHHLRSQQAQGCVLSGKSTSIQTMNKCVRKHGLSSRQIHTKAYWAPGRQGLD